MVSSWIFVSFAGCCVTEIEALAVFPMGAIQSGYGRPQSVIIGARPEVLSALNRSNNQRERFTALKAPPLLTSVDKSRVFQGESRERCSHNQRENFATLKVPPLLTSVYKGRVFQGDASIERPITSEASDQNPQPKLNLVMG